MARRKSARCLPYSVIGRMSAGVISRLLMANIFLSFQRNATYGNVAHQINGAAPRPNSAQAIGLGERLDWMHGSRRLWRIGTVQSFHAMDDVIAGQRAFRGDKGFRRGIGLPGDRFADLEGDLEIALHDAPGSAMPRTTLDHRQIGFGN